MMQEYAWATDPYRIVGNFTWNLVWQILVKPPNKILPIAQCLL